MANQNLNIFEMLKALDARDKSYWDKLSPEARKEFSPYIMLRWASAIQDNNPILQEWYLTETNQTINANFWTLSKHPKLVWLLMCQIGSTRRVRHEYIKRNQDRKDKTLTALQKIYPATKTKDLELLAQTLSKVQLKTLMDEYKYFESNFE